MSASIAEKIAQARAMIADLLVCFPPGETTWSADVDLDDRPLPSYTVAFQGPAEVTVSINPWRLIKGDARFVATLRLPDEQGRLIGTPLQATWALTTAPSRIYQGIINRVVFPGLGVLEEANRKIAAARALLDETARSRQALLSIEGVRKNPYDTPGVSGRAPVCIKDIEGSTVTIVLKRIPTALACSVIEQVYAETPDAPCEDPQ